MITIDLFAKDAFALRGFENLPRLVEAAESQLRQATDPAEIEAAVKSLVGTIIAAPLSIFDRALCERDYVAALTGFVFAIPGLEMLGGDSETRWKLVGNWIDACFPEGTAKAMFDSMMLEDELREKALAFARSGKDDAKFKSWYQLLLMHNILTDAYYYHCETFAEAA
jgi:hypothetical protein